MTRTQTHIILFVYFNDYNQTREYQLTRYDDNKYHIASDSPDNHLCNKSYINPTNLNFSYNNKSNDPPDFLIQWSLTDKNKYEKNYGIALKFNCEEYKNFPLIFSQSYTINEIFEYLKEFTDIEYLYFDLDYSKQFYHKDVYFKKYEKNTKLGIPTIQYMKL